jgi:hypothetical protein
MHLRMRVHTLDSGGRPFGRERIIVCLDERRRPLPSTPDFQLVDPVGQIKQQSLLADVMFRPLRTHVRLRPAVRRLVKAAILTGASRFLVPRCLSRPVNPSTQPGH